MTPVRTPFRLAAAGLATLAFQGLSMGDITYSLNFDPASSGNAQQVANSVAVAAAFYNQHGSFNKHWNVNYNPGIQTAEANYTGYMGYGGSRNERVVFHEAAHTFGMGQHGNYFTLVAGGVWAGQYGRQTQLDTYHDFADSLHGDNHAIWPGGFNYDNEDGFIQRFWHTRIMAAIRADMGVLAYTREARNEAVVAGQTAEFHVESPPAVSYQWFKGAAPLANGGDVSGATTATLRLANAEAADAGGYRCEVTGAGETLSSRTRQLWVHAAPQTGQWNFNSNAIDSINARNGTAFGSPAYVPGRSGQAIDLDGVDDYIDLPDEVSRLRDLTIATWVNWDGGGSWQRVFDFGSSTYQNLFLSPSTAGGNLRLALKDSVNGKNQEFQVNTSALPTGTWVHLAAVIRDDSMTLYKNGQPVGSVFGIGSNPADFLQPTNNYLGKSQYPDALFNGRIDDFRVYAEALNGNEVWSLWGESPNNPPVFSPEIITLPNASAVEAYPAQSLAPYASDADLDLLTFTKLNGPAWISVAANGTVTGQPGAGDGGENAFIVRVADPTGASSDATVKIQTFAPEAAPVTASLAAPVADADDAAYLPGGVNEPDTIDGTTASGDNDDSTYASEDRPSKGQTFTTGPNAQGYFLQSFTIQHVAWPAFTNNGTYHNVQPGDQWEIEVGTMAGTTKTPLRKYTAKYDGTAITGAGDSGTGNFLTFNLSGLGIQLPADTTCYFEVAPLSGDPYFELNSSRTGTYAGGTAFRGNVADDGTIGTGVHLLTGDFAFHAKLQAVTPGAPSTVAYWNFEQGPADAHVPYARTAAGRYEGSIPDLSGHANHLSPWTTGWHWLRNQVPGGTTPRTGAPNTHSVQNAGSFPAISAIGTSLTQWSPTAWTIEAAIRPDDATNGYQTFIGRDSRGAFAGDPNLAALYFSIVPNGGLRCMFTDAAGNNWNLTTAANTIEDLKWQAVAATSDGSTLSLYLKNLTDGDPGYSLLGTLDLSASADPAISTGAGDGADWDAGVFSIARGLWSGGHTDRFFGHLDDIRFSEGALAPAELLHSDPPLTPAEAWRLQHFGSAEDAGDGADGGDPDGDSLANTIERALGGDPNLADADELFGVDNSAARLSIFYTKSKAATDLDVTVFESADLGPASWIPATGSAGVLFEDAEIQRIRFTRPAATNDVLFLRLEITGP